MDGHVDRARYRVFGDTVDCLPERSAHLWLGLGGCWLHGRESARMNDPVVLDGRLGPWVLKARWARARETFRNGPDI